MELLQTVLLIMVIISFVLIVIKSIIGIVDDIRTMKKSEMIEQMLIEDINQKTKMIDELIKQAEEIKETKE
jgi:hypothetical protein